MPEPEPTIQFSGDHGRTWHHAEGRLDAHFETLAREYPARTIRTDCSHTIEFTVPADQADRFWEMFHGIPGWLYDAWTCDRTRPVSRGTAWRDGTYAACQHHLTGPPEPPRPQFPSWQTAVYPRWYLDWMVWQMRHACAELFDPYEWLATRQAGTARTVARDYPPPAEPCQECVAATAPDWLRWVQLIIAPRALQPPRTDFMPRYPNGGRR